MEDKDTERPSIFKLGSLQGYLPLSDTTVSTRGQRLSSIIQERSSPHKRRKHIRIEGEDDDGDLESNADSLEIRHDEHFLPGPNLLAGSRRTSTISNMDQILHTPHMRSLRLIGKDNNPRYQWCDPRIAVDRTWANIMDQGKILQDSRRIEEDEQTSVFEPLRFVDPKLTDQQSSIL